MNFCHNFTQARENSESIIDLPPSIPEKPQILEDNSQIKPIKTRINSKTNTTKYHYNWNKIEQRKYINFLLKHGDLFEFTRDERKCLKINVLMEKSIGTRAAAQCHTHHQKMMVKFGSIEKIIRAHLRLATKKFMPKRFIEIFKELQQEKGVLNRQTQVSEESSGELRDNSRPFWMDYVDLESYDPFFGFPAFPDDSSSLI